MGRLTIDAINPQIVESWSTLFSLVRTSRWDLTCGFCRTPFRSTGRFLRAVAVCPFCGTRNRLVAPPGPTQPLT
jgi:hypothetical protein